MHMSYKMFDHEIVVSVDCYTNRFIYCCKKGIYFFSTRYLDMSALAQLLKKEKEGSGS